tara:strand:+ start:210 stop:728 length:519 start_codon:yes stop_codon:yes gene_type:complete
MNKIRVFCTLTGYQLTWMACAFGDRFEQPALGIYVGIVYLWLYFFFSKNRINLIKILLLISLPGYFFDTLMVYLNIYQFNSSLIIGLLPSWMIFLWFSFSTLFDEILLLFKKHKIIGTILSSTLGPITYYLGESIGVLSINNLFLFFLLMIIFWFFLMLYYLEFILKKINFQ